MSVNQEDIECTKENGKKNRGKNRGKDRGTFNFKQGLKM
jgi:hypothetical protein